MQIWGEEALQFQEKLLGSSGLGDETYFPDSEHSTRPPLLLRYLLSISTSCSSVRGCCQSRALVHGSRVAGDWCMALCSALRALLTGGLRACAGIIQEPMKLTWNTALEETEMVLFETVHKLFKTTGVSPQDVRPLPLPGCGSSRCAAAAVCLARVCSPQCACCFSLVPWAAHRCAAHCEAASALPCMQALEASAFSA